MNLVCHDISLDVTTAFLLQQGHAGLISIQGKGRGGWDVYTIRYAINSRVLLSKMAMQYTG